MPEILHDRPDRPARRWQRGGWIVQFAALILARSLPVKLSMKFRQGGRCTTQRLRGICASIVVAMAGTSIATADDSLDPLRACVGEPDDGRRLECYDRAMGREADPETPGRPAGPSVAPALSPEESFGLTAEQAGKKQNVEPLEQLTSTVAKITQRPHGELVVTLANGQVWAQKQARSFSVRVGDTVTIKAAALGSFMMMTASGGQATRVTRML